MKDSFRQLLSDSTIKISLTLSIFLVVFQSAIIFFLYPKLPPLIPIFNSQPWGVERLFNAPIVLLIPVVLLSVLILNGAISISYYKKHTLIARILSLNSLIFIILGLLAYLQIILLVF